MYSEWQNCFEMWTWQVFSKVRAEPSPDGSSMALVAVNFPPSAAAVTQGSAAPALLLTAPAVPVGGWDNCPAAPKLTPTTHVCSVSSGPRQVWGWM